MARKAAKRARKPAASDRDWAVRDLKGPPPGPLSIGLRTRILSDVCEASRVNDGPGRRSMVWAALGEAVVVECATRVIIHGEPAQAVAREVCGVADPAKDKDRERRAKRVQELLSSLRADYITEYARHSKGAKAARQIDDFKGDLPAVMRQLAIKVALRLNDELDPENYDAKDNSERHLLIRMFNSLIASTEINSKTEKLDVEAEKVRRTIEGAKKDVERGRMKPEELELLLDRLADGDTNEQALKHVRNRQQREAA